MSRVRDLQDEYVVCRTVGHAWDEFTPTVVRSALWRAERAALFLRCTRCHTERLDYFDNGFDVMSRQYRHPEGYKATRTRVATLRGEMLRRSLLGARSTGRRAA